MDATGYYSLMQYVPNVRRNEGLNCGLLLLCPSQNYLDIKTNPSVSRLSHVFRNKSIEHIKAQIRYAQIQILSQKTKLLNDESYLYLPLKNFNEVRFTPLVTTKVGNQALESLHQELYCELVNEEESILIHTVRLLLDQIKDNLFFLNKRGQVVEHEKITFTRANDLLIAADVVRDILDD